MDKVNKMTPKLTEKGLLIWGVENERYTLSITDCMREHRFIFEIADEQEKSEADLSYTYMWAFVNILMNSRTKIGTWTFPYFIKGLELRKTDDMPDGVIELVINETAVKLSLDIWVHLYLALLNHPCYLKSKEFLSTDKGLDYLSDWKLSNKELSIDEIWIPEDAIY